MEKPSKKQLEQWHKDPANWKFGFIYVNKADKRIFPPKKNANFGYTINFANPLSILMLFALLIFFSGMSYLFRHL